LTGGVTNLNGGTLTATAVNFLAGGVTASGTINGNVTNAGQFALGGPATPGALLINGDYTQTATGVLNIKIGGLTAGTQYDRLDLTSGHQATLNGTLNVRLIDNFFPTIGDTFQLLTFSSLSGTFSTMTGLALGGNPARHFDPTFNPTDLTLVTAAG
jgi:hypothetical protein